MGTTSSAAHWAQIPKPSHLDLTVTLVSERGQALVLIEPYHCPLCHHVWDTAEQFSTHLNNRLCTTIRKTPLPDRYYIFRETRVPEGRCNVLLGSGERYLLPCLRLGPCKDHGPANSKVGSSFEDIKSDTRNIPYNFSMNIEKYISVWRRY